MFRHNTSVWQTDILRRHSPRYAYASRDKNEPQIFRHNLLYLSIIANEKISPENIICNGIQVINGAQISDVTNHCKNACFKWHLNVYTAQFNIQQVLIADIWHNQTSNVVLKAKRMEGPGLDDGLGLYSFTDIILKLTARQLRLKES